MRVFARLREVLATNQALAQNVDKKLTRRIRGLTAPPRRKNRIGFC